MAAGGEQIFVLQVTEEVPSNGAVLALPTTFITAQTVNANNRKRPIETITLSDSEENGTQGMSLQKAIEQVKRQKAEEAAEKKRALESAKYCSVQEVFNNYPGLFTFYQKGKFEKTYSGSVLCKACNIPVHFNNLAAHSELPIHNEYFQPNSDLLSYNKPPDVQSIMDSNKGIFSNIVSNRKVPSIESEQCVYCNPCQKKISKKHLLRHLGTEGHVTATIQFMTCEADFSAVAETLTDKTFSIYGNELFCNPCRITLPDTLRSLRFHIKTIRHIEAKQKHDVNRILSDFGNVITLKGSKATPSKQKTLWCTKCEIAIIDGYENVVKHIEGSTHSGRIAPLKERYIGDDEFNQDLAEMFAENKIAFQKIKSMRNFLEKYTNRVMPDATVLRQAVSDRKKKVKPKDDTETAAAAFEDASEDGQEMIVYKEVYQEEEDTEDEQEALVEEVVSTEEIEVEVVQFPAVTSDLKDE